MDTQSNTKDDMADMNICPGCGAAIPKNEAFCADECALRFYDAHAEHDDEVPGNGVVEEAVREIDGLTPYGACLSLIPRIDALMAEMQAIMDRRRRAI